MTVSHDRYFLDRVCNRIFSFEGNGSLNQYEGGYTDYQNASRSTMKLTDSGLSPSEKAELSSKKTTTRNNWKQNQPQKPKMSFQEQKEFETIESDIANLEAQIQDLEEQILKAAKDFVKLNELTQKQEECKKQLSDKLERWVYLEELQEQIALSKAQNASK